MWGSFAIQPRRPRRLCRSLSVGLLAAAIVGCQAAPSAADRASLGPTAGTGSSPLPSPSPSATPDPAPDAEASQVLANFTSRISAPDKHFQAHQQGRLVVGGRTTGLFTYDLALSGNDAMATARIGTTEFSIIVLGDRAWVQQLNGDWLESSRAEINGDDIVDVFRYVGDPANLAFVGIDTGGVERQFHFRPTRPVPYETAQIREAGGTGQITTMDVYTLPDGTPLRVDFEFEATIPAGDEVSGWSSINFFDWGKPVEIRAPT